VEVVANEQEQAPEYAVIIEPVFDEAGRFLNYGAYVPDLPGCVAGAETFDETERLIREAVALHLGAMRRDGDPIPAPRTRVTTVPVEA
jgi:predicted RNase H-like HicB family nuclease